MSFFFPFLSFSLSVLLSGWLLGTQELYWLSVLIKENQASFSLFLLSLSPRPSSWGYPWILLGLDPGTTTIWDARDTDLIPGLGRSPGEGHVIPLQYSCLENPMDRGLQSTGLQKVGHDWSKLARGSFIYLFIFLRNISFFSHWVVWVIYKGCILILYQIYVLNF